MAPFASIVLAAALAQLSPADFNARFDDSRAELDAYQLTRPRYGEPRNGCAVMIWVLEPFSRSKAVKLDHPQRTPADVQRVMKLNLIERFRTGIYDYSLMTSVFSPVVPADAPPASRTPIKVAFTAQEWCGTVFSQLVRDPKGLRAEGFSYFESEGDTESRIELTGDTLLEDELWWRARELLAPLTPGSYRLVPSLASVRLSHLGADPGTVSVTRQPEPKPLVVPAGSFEVVRFDFALKWGPGGSARQKRSVWVERQAPRRIIAWQTEVAGFSGNEPGLARGELLRSSRDTYWKHNRVGDEALFGGLCGIPAK